MLTPQLSKHLIMHLLLSIIDLGKKISKGVVQVNLCQKFFFLQNMGRTCCVQKLFWMSETIDVHSMLSPGLSLEFSCIELVIRSTCNSKNNLLSYCGLLYAKLRASDKDLPVLNECLY